MAASKRLSGANAPQGVLASRMHLKVFPGSLQEYPFQEGASLNAANVNYMSLKAMGGLKRLKERENIERGN